MVCGYYPLYDLAFVACKCLSTIGTIHRSKDKFHGFLCLSIFGQLLKIFRKLLG